MPKATMMTRMRGWIQRLVAGAGVKLIASSKIADGYWRPWRLDFFDNAQKLGLHILPVHYYTPIPNSQEIQDDDRPIFTDHVDYQTEEALRLVCEIAERYKPKLDIIRERNDPTQQRFSFEGSPYHPGEAEVLYGMIRSGRPSQIIEIGCGYSTLLIAEALADAAQDDPDYECEYTCYEPYRPEYLHNPPPQVTRFIDKPVQSLDPEHVARLNAGDLLFIDSTHVVKMQSDVVHEFLALLPALKPGVNIHVHDIFLPYDYPMSWMQRSRFFWNEQYMLYAYLLGNPSIEVTIPMHRLYREYGDQLLKHFPSINNAKMPPSAIWLRTK